MRASIVRHGLLLLYTEAEAEAALQRAPMLLA